MIRIAVWVGGVLAALVIAVIVFTLLRRGPLAPDYTPNGGLNFVDGTHGSVTLEAGGECPTCAWLLERTDDGGLTWSSTKTDDMPPWPETAFQAPGPRDEIRDVVVPGKMAWGIRQGRRVTAIRTFDGGRTWRAAGAPCTRRDGRGDAVAATSPKRAWLLCHPGSKPGSKGEAKTLFATADGGRTWRRAGQLPFAGQVTSESLSFGDERLGLLSRYDVKPLVTRDGGKRWTPVHLSEPVGVTWDIEAASDRDAYLIGQIDIDGQRRFTLYATHDQAATWDPVRRWYTDIPSPDY